MVSSDQIFSFQISKARSIKTERIGAKKNMDIFSPPLSTKVSSQPTGVPAMIETIDAVRPIGSIQSRRKIRAIQMTRNARATNQRALWMDSKIRPGLPVIILVMAT